MPVYGVSSLPGITVHQTFSLAHSGPCSMEEQVTKDLSWLNLRPSWIARSGIHMGLLFFGEYRWIGGFKGKPKRTPMPFWRVRFTKTHPHEWLPFSKRIGPQQALNAGGGGGGGVSTGRRGLCFLEGTLFRLVQRENKRTNFDTYPFCK